MNGQAKEEWDGCSDLIQAGHLFKIPKPIRSYGPEELLNCLLKGNVVGWSEDDSRFLRLRKVEYILHHKKNEYEVKTKVQVCFIKK